MVKNEWNEGRSEETAMEILEEKEERNVAKNKQQRQRGSRELVEKNERTRKSRRTKTSVGGGKEREESISLEGEMELAWEKRKKNR